MTTPVVWIVAGGTAGHVHGALELAQATKSLARVLLITGDRPVEDAVLAGSDVERLCLTERGLPRPGRRVDLRALARNGALLRGAPRPRLALGLGGAHEVPSLLVARARGAHLAILEQNAVLGRANALLAPVCERVFLAWPTPVPRLVRARARIVGPPARSVASRAEARARLGIDRDALVLVVTSGTLGAQRLNEAIVEAEGRGVLSGVTVLHYLGAQNLPASIPAASSRYRPFVGFDPSLVDAIAAADLVVARAGSSTLTEIAAAGVASVLVPLPGAPGDHQRRNAALFEHSGAARVVEEGPQLSARLAATITELLGHESERAAMAAAARSLGVGDAAARVVEEVAQWLT